MRLTTLVPGLLAAAALAAPGFAAPPLAFPTTSPGPLSLETMDWVLARAREALRGERRVGEPLPPGPLEVRQVRPQLLVISALAPRRRTIAALGAGDDLREAVAACLDDLARRHGPSLGPHRARGVRLQVDRLGPARELGPLALGTLSSDRVRPAVDGLAMAGLDRLSILLPHELVAQGLVRDRNVDERRLGQILLDGLGPAGARDGASVWAFTTRAFAERAPGEAVELERGLPVLGDLTPAKLDRGLRALARHLARSQRPDGRLRYQLDPARGVDPGGENLVRQAAAVMSAIEALHALPEDSVLRTVARRGAAFVARSLVKTPLSAGRAVLLPPPDREGGPPLGAVALAARALTLAANRLKGAEGLRERARQVGQGILFMQRPDGSWYRDLRSAQRGEPPLRPLRFYPGEALLALTELAEADPGGPWLEAASRSARWTLRAHQAGVEADHWGIQGLARFSIVADQPWAAEASVRMAARMASGQLTPSRAEHPGDVGGFSPDGRGALVVHTACIGEALRGAREAAWRFGLDPRFLERAQVRLARYLLSHQVRGPGAYILDAPRAAVGGFPRTPGDWRQRVDVDAHALRALLGTWEALHGVHPTPRIAEVVEGLASPTPAAG